MPLPDCDEPAPCRIVLPQESDTWAFAAQLAPRLRRGDVVALDGPLGAGKTTFVRALVAALGGDPALVASPTYTLMHCYQATLPLVHVDAYRLAACADLDALGFAELVEDGLGCVEWADRLPDFVRQWPRCWRLIFAHHDQGRVVELVAPAAVGPEELA
jgi:tRNA threonylcarbamoyladenosine biosynthesis protein TsaE